MTAGGDVTVSVRLGLDTLARDAAAAAARIRASLPDQTVGIKINNEGIGKLAADVLKAKAGLADTGSAVFLQKEAALLQEALRFKQQIADIENAYVDADDIKNAQQLAAELHDLNKQQIDRDFSPNVPNLPVPKGLAGHAQAFQDAVNEASLYTQALSQVGAQLTQTGQQINAFTQQASGAAIAFDSARAKVATLADNSGELAQQSRDLSKELNFQVGSTELLGATYDIVSSGFEETADVLEILKAASQGAIGGLTDVGVVADAVTSVLQSYNMNADQAGKVTDILAQTVDSGKISFEQLAGGIGQITGIAFQAGVSFEELNAAIATATAKGTPASSSISGTRQAIINLLKPTADAKAVLEQFGIANAAATLKAEGLVGILQRLKDQGASTEQLSEIFSDTDGFAVVSQLAGNNLGAFIDNIDRMNNSAGKAQAATQQIASSFQGELTAALNQANEALIDLGNGVLKAATPLVQALGFILTNFNKLPDGVKESIGVVVALTGGLVTLAGAVLSVAAILPIVTAGLKQMGIMGTAAGAGATATAQGATAASVSLRGLATAAGGLILKMGLLAAAMKTTEIALSRFKDGGESFNAAAEKIEQSLVDLQLESGRTRVAIESALPKDPPPTDFVDGIVSKFNDLNGTLNRAFGLPEDFLAIPENSQKQLEDTRAGVLNLQTAVDALVEGSKSLSADFLADKERGRTPGTEQVEQAKQTQEAFTTALEETRKQLEALDASKLGTEAYAQLKTQLEGTIEQLEREKTAFERNTGLQAANTQTTQQAAAAAKEQVSAIEKATAAYAQQSGELERSNKQRQAEVAKSVASGIITEEQGREQNLKNEQRYLSDRLTLNQQKLAELRDIRSNDPAEQKQIQEEILGIENQIADDRLAVAQNLADQRVAAEKRASDAIKRQIEDVGLAAQQQTTGVRRRQASGEISEEDADAEIAGIEAQSIDRQIALLQQRQQVVRAGSDEARDLAQELADLQEQAANKEISQQEAIKAAAEEAAKARLDEIDRANKAAESAIQQSQAGEINAVRQMQAQRVISVEEAEARIAQIQQRGREQEVALTQRQIAEVASLREQGLLSEEDATERLIQLNDELGTLNQERIEAEIEAQDRLREARLDAVERSNRQAESAIGQDVTAEITAVRQLQAERVISVEEAEAEIAAIQQQGRDREAAQVQRQIEQIRQLRAEGVLSEEESVDKIIELNGRLGDLSQERIEAEIDAQENLKEAAIEAIEEQLDLRKQAAEVEQGLNQIAIDSINSQNSLLSAQNSLIQAQAGLAEQRLQYAVEDAEASGNTAQAEQLRQQLISQQTAAQERQFAIAQQQLDLKREQLALETQQKQIQADIAITEAEIALSTAAINGENQEVIAGLERILDLRHQQRQAINSQNKAQQRSIDLEREALSVQQQQARERQARQRTEASRNSSNNSSGSNSSGNQSGSSRGSTGSGSGSGFAPRQSFAPSRTLVGRQTLVAAMGAGSTPANYSYGGIGGSRTSQPEWRTPEWSDGRSSPASNNTMSRLLSPTSQSSNLRLSELARSGLQSDVPANRTAQQPSGGMLTSSQFNSGISQLSQRITVLANAPRAVTVQTPDPVRDFQRISSDMMRAKANAAGI